MSKLFQNRLMGKKTSRTENSGLNIVTNWISQLVVAASGLILPQVFIRAYGSEVNGLVSSITQFLLYIALLELGVGGVVRASLYKPLATNDMQTVSGIVKATRNFYWKIGIIFCFYIVGLCVCFPLAVKSSLGTTYVVCLILILSIDVVARYFISAPYALLVEADQMGRLNNILTSVLFIANIIVVYVLISFGLDARVVKLVSALVFLIRPIYYRIYVSRHYKLIKGALPHNDKIKERWNGAVHSISYFIHNNTDVAILSLFSGLKTVSVYAVYNAVVVGLTSSVSAIHSGAGASLGNLLVTEDKKTVNDRFDLLEFVENAAMIVLFTTAIFLILPFALLYTKGVEDVNYSEPVFGTILLIGGGINCIKSLYSNMYTVAGKFKETQKLAATEAIINLLVSILLVFRFGLVGVAIGTTVAMVVRCVCDVIFLSKNIIYRPVKKFIKLVLVDAGISLSSLLLLKLFYTYPTDNWGKWIIAGIVSFATVLCISVMFFWVFYRKELKRMCELLLKTLRKRKKLEE